KYREGSRWWRMPSSFDRCRFTRRTATVTISAPDASIARVMSSFVAYLPVPTSSREWNSRPPITSGASSIGATTVVTSPSSNKVYDLYRVTGRERLCGIRGAIAKNRAVVFHHHQARFELELAQQIRDGGACGDGARFPVHHWRDDAPTNCASAHALKDTQWRRVRHRGRPRCR